MDIKEYREKLSQACNNAQVIVPTKYFNMRLIEGKLLSKNYIDFTLQIYDGSEIIVEKENEQLNLKDFLNCTVRIWGGYYHPNEL